MFVFYIFLMSTVKTYNINLALCYFIYTVSPQYKVHKRCGYLKSSAGWLTAKDLLGIGQSRATVYFFAD